MLGTWCRQEITASGKDVKLFSARALGSKVEVFFLRVPRIKILRGLRLFLDDINFPADNVTARVTWKFRGGGKVRQILYDATHRFQN